MNASTGVSRIKHKEVQKPLQLHFKGIAAGKTKLFQTNVTWILSKKNGVEDILKAGIADGLLVQLWWLMPFYFQQQADGCLTTNLKKMKKKTP